jgi:hypothetical protein
MASFLVEVYEPDPRGSGFTRTVDSLREASEAISREGGRVRHVRSYVVPGDEMCFHVLEAESEDEVTQTLGLAGIKAGRVVEAIGVRSEP